MSDMQGKVQSISKGVSAFNRQAHVEREEYEAHPNKAAHNGNGNSTNSCGPGKNFDCFKEKHFG